MATDDHAPEVDRQAVYADLASTLQRLRDGVHARDMAADVFRHATGSTALVGLTDGGERAVFYEANARTLVAVPLDEHGLDRPDTERLWNRLSDPTGWVDARGGDLAWVHPRYRWVRDADASAWEAQPGGG
jgi:hypothetical protein